MCSPDEVVTGGGFIVTENVGTRYRIDVGSNWTINYFVFILIEIVVSSHSVL
jgi:hypothetical protein